MANGLKKLDGFLFHAVELPIIAGVDACEPNLGGKIDQDSQIGLCIANGELIDRLDFLGIDGTSDALVNWKRSQSTI